MTLSLINESASDRLVGTLCNTLMHSLWQGTLLAAVAGLIVLCTRKASPALRYNLLISALLLFAVGVSATFVWQYQKSEDVMVTGTLRVMQPFHADNVVIMNPIAPVTQAMPVSHISFSDRVNSYLDDHRNTIVLIWFLIICARSLQLGVGLYGTYRLRRVRVFAVKNHWPERMQKLADALGIKQTITLLESGLAKVPMVIGHLKPVVLIPIGLLTALSAEEVEAILIHELAHIKRRDYLVNMLQSLMEIAFFFNPAVLWVSKLIKTERENCCDDMVLAQNNNKLDYIRALVSCDQYRSSVPAYAMGLPGSKNTLLSRAKRMASNRNYSLNVFEKTMLAVCLVVLGLGASAFTAREHIKRALHSVVAAIHHEATESRAKTVKSDTTKKKSATPLNDVNSLLNQLQQPDSHNTTGSSALDALVRNVDSLRGTNSQLSSLNGNLSGFKGSDNPLSRLGRPDTNLLKLQAPNQQAIQASIQARDVGRELYREHLITDTNHLSITTHLDKRELIVNGVRMPDDVYQRMYEKFYQKRGNGSYGGNTNSNNISESDDDKTKSIINDMMKDGIITSTEDLSFKIGTTEFVVNYKKQPEAVYQRYRAKYVPGRPKGDWIWFYRFDTDKWDQIEGRKSSEDFHGSATGVFQGKENANASGYSSSGYNSGDYDRQNESQKKYWDGRQWKVMDQIKREGLIAGDATVFSFSLSDKRFMINGALQSDEVFKRYYREYAPANPGPNWDWSYHNRWDAHSDSLRKDRNRVEAERDKRLVADLLKDGLITDPNNVTFTLNNNGVVTINGKKQSDAVYKKYKDKYIPDNTGTGWNWTFSHHE